MFDSKSIEIGGGAPLQKRPRTSASLLLGREDEGSSLVLRVLLDDGSHRWEAEMRRWPKEGGELLLELDSRRRGVSLPALEESPLKSHAIGTIVVVGIAVIESFAFPYDSDCQWWSGPDPEVFEPEILLPLILRFVQRCGGQTLRPSQRSKC